MCIRDRVYSHQETGDWKSFERDKKIATFFREKGIHWNEFQNNGVARGLKNRDMWQSQWHKVMSQPYLTAGNVNTENSNCQILLVYYLLKLLVLVPQK
mgnify:CR=1 FL=1